MNSKSEICFAAEPTLGKLAKWLMILGFDTSYEAGFSAKKAMDSGRKNRILLTRTERVRDGKLPQEFIFLTSNNPFEQLREVIDTLGIIYTDTRPFSRCIRCNTRIQPVDKDSVRGNVPDFIWQTSGIFQKCGRCRRIYWPGSHTQRSHDIIMRLFECYDNR
ncbi:MAG: Mut7-C RNAse domain-containing protein [Thermodesulfobacteriota bacterium]|nr:Mut7-C RNAse domain-containing protein [Thermodesulfobacteriota bacterium]